MKPLLLKNIKQIIPHRHPMIMIDTYQRIDNDAACSSMRFEPGSYGCENGWVMEGMLIEAFAQTVAAHFGYEALKTNETDSGPGMLTSVDEFEFYDMISDTSTISIRIEKTDEIGPFKLVSGDIHVENRLVAKGRIKVFKPGEENKG